MDDLRNQYASLRSKYKPTLASATSEQDPDKRSQLLIQLIDLNTKMNEIVSQMMKVVAQKETNVNLDELNTHLSDELVRIQQEARQLHSSKDDTEVLRRLAQQTPSSSSTDVSIYMYLGALAIGLFLIILAILNASFATPAMPPLATPQLGSPESGLW